MPRNPDFPHHAQVIATTTVAVGTTSVQIAAANAFRRKIIIRNTSGTRILYINFNAAATTANANVQVAPGELYIMTEPELVWPGAINAVHGGIGTSDVIVTQFSDD